MTHSFCQSSANYKRNHHKQIDQSLQCRNVENSCKYLPSFLLESLEDESSNCLQPRGNGENSCTFGCFGRQNNRTDYLPSYLMGSHEEERINNLAPRCRQKETEWTDQTENCKGPPINSLFDDLRARQSVIYAPNETMHDANSYEKPRLLVESSMFQSKIDSEDYWVSVYGFLRTETEMVLQEFNAACDIEHHMLLSDSMILKTRTKIDCMRALRLNKSIINGQHMLGVYKITTEELQGLTCLPPLKKCVPTIGEECDEVFKKKNRNFCFSDLSKKLIDYFYCKDNVPKISKNLCAGTRSCPEKQNVDFWYISKKLIDYFWDVSNKLIRYFCDELNKLVDYYIYSKENETNSTKTYLSRTQLAE